MLLVLIHPHMRAVRLHPPHVRKAQQMPFAKETLPAAISWSMAWTGVYFAELKAVWMAEPLREVANGFTSGWLLLLPRALLWSQFCLISLLKIWMRGLSVPSATFQVALQKRCRNASMPLHSMYHEGQ